MLGANLRFPFSTKVVHISVVGSSTISKPGTLGLINCFLVPFDHYTKSPVGGRIALSILFYNALISLKRKRGIQRG